MGTLEELPIHSKKDDMWFTPCQIDDLKAQNVNITNLQKWPKDGVCQKSIRNGIKCNQKN